MAIEKNMKLLAINGSPREGGNTDTLMDKILEGASSGRMDVEKIYLAKLNISPCSSQEYEKISPEGFSVVVDDMQDIFKAVESSDVVLLGSPVFFGSLTAQIKIMIDRFQCVWLANNVYKKDIFTKIKKGAFLCVEASCREDFFRNAESIVKHFFATCNIEYEYELFCPGLEKESDASCNTKYLEKAFQLGEKIAKTSL